VDLVARPPEVAGRQGATESAADDDESGRFASVHAVIRFYQSPFGILPGVLGSVFVRIGAVLRRRVFE
jgi:hypothetical protein